MLSALLAAAVLSQATPQTMTLEDLSITEIVACSLIGWAGKKNYFGETTPATDSERAIWEALDQLETRAREEADRQMTARNYTDEHRQTEDSYARDMLGRASDDEAQQMFEACAGVFNIALD